MRRNHPRRSNGRPRAGGTAKGCGVALGTLVAVTGIWLTSPRPIPAHYQWLDLSVSGLH